jgi:hypothetical protein
MSKTLTLSVLTLVALGPLAMAGKRPTFVHKPGFAPPTQNFTASKTTFKATTTATTTTATFKPPFHPPIPTFPTTVAGFKPGKPVTPIATPLKGATTNYFATNGVKFSGGVFYKGQAHLQWTKRYFSPRWKTWCFYCPFAKGWFYFNGTLGGFYPVSYIVVAPPVATLPGTAFLPPGGNEVPIVPTGEEPELPQAG